MFYSRVVRIFLLMQSITLVVQADHQHKERKGAKDGCFVCHGILLNLKNGSQTASMKQNSW